MSTAPKPAADKPVDPALEMKSINEEYKIWKKNTPFLYDIVMTHALEWPSLTVQWFPDKVAAPGKDYTVQRLLMGTHTSDGEQNHVLIGEVRLPREEAPVEGRNYERNESGGYSGASGKVEIVQQILHDGEVNRARYMPQNPNIIATKSPSKEVFIFDKTKHPSKPARNGECNPDLRLLGHKKEGYGISWSPAQEGLLISGSEDMLVCMWDINAGSSKDTTQQAASIFSGHTDVVEDVVWHPTDVNMFVSCGDDKLICVWDPRAGSSPVQKVEGHKGEVNCIAFNAKSTNVLASGSGDHTCAMWDIRSMKQKMVRSCYLEAELFLAMLSILCYFLFALSLCLFYFCFSLSISLALSYIFYLLPAHTLSPGLLLSTPSKVTQIKCSTFLGRRLLSTSLRRALPIAESLFGT